MNKACSPVGPKTLSAFGSNIITMDPRFPSGFGEATTFPLGQALRGRRARRFSLGSSIPDGALKFTSSRPAFPLSDVEKALVLAAVSGGTGWHYLIPSNQRYAPYLPNYSGSARGRTFPSAAGFHTSNTFYTDDEGVYYLPTRDGPPPTGDGEDENAFTERMEAQERNAVKLSPGRLALPAEEAHVESHNQ